MVAVAADVLRNAPFERFALAGLSMGGYVALEILRQAPGRVSHLALLDTSARADSPEQTIRRKELIALAERGRFIGVSEALLPLLVHPRNRDNAGLVATVKAMARNTGRDVFVRHERAIMSRRDSRPDLRAIDCPVLVLCGNEDILTPPELHEEMAAGIPGAKLVVLRECGHLSTLEQPDAVTTAMREWLAR